MCWVRIDVEKKMEGDRERERERTCVDKRVSTTEQAGQGNVFIGVKTKGDPLVQ